MSWILLVITSTITLSIAYILQRVLMKDDKSDAVSYAIIFQFVLAFIALLFAIAFGKFTLNISSDLYPRFILSAVLWAGYTTLAFRAAKILTAGEVTVLTSASAVVAIVLGIILLGEVLSFQAIIGAILILLSIIIINLEKLSFSSKKGITYALLAAVFGGIAGVNDAVVLKSYEAFSYTAIMSFLPGVVLMIAFPKRISMIKKLVNLKLLTLISIFCIFYAIQAITYYQALHIGAPVSVLSPLTKSSVVLTVILGALFLHERSNLGKKFIAAIVVIIGAILLSR